MDKTKCCNLCYSHQRSLQDEGKFIKVCSDSSCKCHQVEQEGISRVMEENSLGKIMGEFPGVVMETLKKAYKVGHQDGYEAGVSAENSRWEERVKGLKLTGIPLTEIIGGKELITDLLNKDKE